MSNTLYDYIEGITKDPNNQILIDLGHGHVYSGFIDSELTFGATSEYGSLSDSSTIDKISNGVQTIAGEMGSTMTLKFPFMTKKSWNGSKVNDISFSFYKLATETNENLIEKTAGIWSSTLPSLEKEGVQGKIGSYSPPNGYTQGSNDGKPKNSLTIRIGNWFESNGWVITSSTLTVSKEKIDEAKTLPLYIKIDVTLTRDMDSTAYEFQSWFSGMGVK